MGGSDYVVGGGGYDTFIFNSGYGHLEIREIDGAQANNVLQLGAGIDPTDITARIDSSGNLLLTDGVSGDLVTIQGFSNTGWGIEMVEFADSTVWTKSDIIANASTGTTGNDTLYGTGGPETFDGKGGNDFIRGFGGNDTFIFNSGYGHLEIYESDSTSASNVLDLGSGIDPANITARINFGGDLVMTDGVSGDQITLDGFSNSAGWGVQSLVFADSTVLHRADLIALASTGTSGSDALYGTGASETFDGKGGNDFIRGNGGNDTFIYNSGYGHLEIYESDSTSASNVLDLGPGIDPGDVVVRINWNGDLVLTDSVSGDQIYFDGFSNSAGWGVQSVHFDDATVWSRADLITKASTGTTGSDSLYGTGDAETFDGQGGTDDITGRGGADTYLFNSGYGSLSISNNGGYGSGAHAELDFGTGIDDEDLWFSRSGDDLRIQTIGSSDRVTVSSWFNGDSSRKLSEIKLSGGLEIDSQLDTLISAMATFSTNNPGFDAATATAMPTDTTLQSAITAAWH